MDNNHGGTDDNHGYQNTENMEVDNTPLFPVERPDGYHEGWFSNTLQKESLILLPI